ncbi:MAG: antibiotic biosynthesis monooxygenase [Sneathiellales bacterium]|nr:antibiotic biosynthesis monooxygenase [Sneathiellales bacterium]
MSNNNQPPATSSAILALEAFEHVHTERTAEYEVMGQDIDDRVRETEPGMLVHALTKISSSETETTYRWLEVFENPKALQAHLDNPHVQNHIAKLGNGILSSPTEIVIYADWDDQQKAYWTELFGADNLEFAPLKSGFFLKR